MKLRQTDFQKVDALLAEQAKQNLNEVDESHYLYSFSNDELLEVLSKPDEWNEVDYVSYKKVLPNGERIYGYRRQDRAHGKLIFIISIAVALIIALLKMYRIESWRSVLLGQ